MKKWGIIITLSLAMFIIVIDTTIMNVSITTVAQDLNTTVSGVQSAISLYALTMAALMLTSGKLSDVIGKKHTFLIGLGFYGAGTLITSISQTLGMLILGWSVIEGIGGALMMPTIQNILRDSYTGKMRATGYGVLGGVAAVGAALGPLIGGILTTYASWRWAFVLEFIIVVVVLLLSRMIKKDVLAKTKPKFDFGGAILVAVGMILMVLGVLVAGTYGWWTAKQPFMIGDLAIAPFGLSITPFLVGFGIITLLGFFRYENHRKAKGQDLLMDPETLENRPFKRSLNTRFLNMFVTASLLYLLPLFMQTYLGLDAFRTGLGLMPLSLGIVIFALLGTKLSNTRLPKKIITYGFIVSILGFITMLAMSSVDMTVENLVLGSFVVGIGLGLIASQIVNLVLSTVQSHQVAEATGINATFEQLGNALGVAIIGTVLIGTYNTGIRDGINQSDTLPTQVKTSSLAAIDAAGGIENLNQEQIRTNLSQSPQVIQDSFQDIYASASITAFDGALVFLAFVSGVALLMSLSLPAKKLA